jgi:branched-chain amino acid transport system ATP-binding protein
VSEEPALTHGTFAAGGQAAPLLEVRDLSVHHGQLQALHGVSLALPAGSVHAMIGANGAGKSTLLRTIVGLHRPTSGTVLLEGTDVTGLRPDQRVAAGLVMVPEGRRLFPSLTVEENLLVGLTSARRGPWTVDAVYELFDWMRDRRTQHAALLSGGEQQAVALGRALVANPKVLLLDELSLGLAPVVVRRIYELLPRLLRSGLTVLLVEQDVSQALGVASMVHCLLEGRITLEGRPAELAPAQIESAYFGATGARGKRNGNGNSVPPAASAPHPFFESPGAQS